MDKLKGVLIIISGPSGSGKDTVIDRLLELDLDTKVSISMTTREIRDYEVDGENYYFVSRDFFEKKIKENAVLEFAEYAGNYYGTPKDPVDKMLNEGKNVILKIDVQGAEKIRNIYPDVISIFLTPPSISVLEDRLRKRGSEDEETLRHRLNIALHEYKRAYEYDYLVINDDLESAVNNIRMIILSEKMKIKNNKNFLSEVISNV